MINKRIVFLYIPPIADAVGNGIVDAQILDSAFFFAGTQYQDILAEAAGSALKLDFTLAGKFFAALAKAKAENRLHAFSTLNYEWPVELKRFLVEHGLYVSNDDALTLQHVENGDYASALPLDSTFSVFGVNSDFSLLSTGASQQPACS